MSDEVLAVAGGHVAAAAAAARPSAVGRHTEVD